VVIGLGVPRGLQGLKDESLSVRMRVPVRPRYEHASATNAGDIRCTVRHAPDSLADLLQKLLELGTAYDSGHRIPIGRISVRKGEVASWLRILLASSGTIHWAVQPPCAATDGLQPNIVLSVKRLERFLRFQAK